MGFDNRLLRRQLPELPANSIYEASERDFRIVVAEDAISGLHDTGRRELENIGVRLMSSADLLDALASAAATSRA